MKDFGLDKKHEQFNFDEVTVEELEVISGGSGGSLSAVEGSIALTGIALGAYAVGFAVAAPLAAIGAAGLGAYAAYSNYA